LPTEFRVLFASCTDLLWQIVCSKITSSEIEVAPPTQLPRTASADSVLDVSVEAALRAPSPLVVVVATEPGHRMQPVAVSSTDLRALSLAAVDALDTSTNAVVASTEVHTTTIGQRPPALLAVRKIKLEQQLVR
jgi:hypothetical protein